MLQTTLASCLHIVVHPLILDLDSDSPVSSRAFLAWLDIVKLFFLSYYRLKLLSVVFQACWTRQLIRQLLKFLLSLWEVCLFFCSVMASVTWTDFSWGLIFEIKVKSYKTQIQNFVTFFWSTKGTGLTSHQSVVQLIRSLWRRGLWLKLNWIKADVCTSITCWFFDLTTSVVVYRGRTTNFVSLPNKL